MSASITTYNQCDTQTDGRTDRNHTVCKTCCVGHGSKLQAMGWQQFLELLHFGTVAANVAENALSIKILTVYKTDNMSEKVFQS